MVAYYFFVSMNIWVFIHKLNVNNTDNDNSHFSLSLLLGSQLGRPIVVSGRSDEVVKGLVILDLPARISEYPNYHRTIRCSTLNGRLVPDNTPLLSFHREFHLGWNVRNILTSKRNILLNTALARTRGLGKFFTIIILYFLFFSSVSVLMG